MFYTELKMEVSFQTYKFQGSVKLVKMGFELNCLSLRSHQK